jgi:Fe-S oxidoreductase
MYEDEPCCGSPTYYAGFESDYAEHAKRNYQVFKSFGIKNLIGLVPGCTSALRDVYPKYVEGYDLEVQHVLEVLAKRLKETGIKPKLKKKLAVTYHDPCQLSRYLGITDEPRQILKAIESVELIEPDLERCGKWSTCCGGGGLEVTHPELSERLGIRRAKELLKTGANVIVSNCPACDLQLTKITKKLDASVAVIDFMRLLDEALG